MKTIITTVGTSVFTNLIKDGKNEGIRQRFEKLQKPKQKRFSEWENHEYRTINDRGSRQGLKSLVKDAIQTDPKASAEIESILKIAKNEEVKVHLLATDTILSVLAAKIVKEWFEGKQEVSFNAAYGQDVIEGLQVEDVNDFRKSGLPNLLNRLDELIVDENYSPYVSLNITGGYKGIIPFATAYAQINEIPILYLFEEENDVIKFPPFPIDVDYGFIGKHMNVFEELSSTKEGKWETFSQQKNLPPFFSNYVDVVGDGNEELFELNPIGKYIFKRFRDYHVIEIERSCNIFSENAGNRNQLFQALRELIERIGYEVFNNNIKQNEELLRHINQLGDKNDLRHGSNPSQSMFIFKSTKKEQIRIVYTPLLENGYLSLKMYDFKRGSFNHSTYITELNQKFKLKSQFDFIKITLKK